MTDLFLTAGRLLPLLDLTSLRDAHDDDVLGLCRAAMTPAGPVAARMLGALLAAAGVLVLGGIA